ncbi:MAG: LEA type 2 family protein [Polyangiaceae bacterium]
MRSITANSRALLFAPLVLVAATACEKPAAPTIKPIDAKVKSVTLTGLDIDLKLEATNPNVIPLSARKVKAHVWVNGDVDLGELTIPTKVSIPAKDTITMNVPLSVEWKNVAALGLAAATSETMPFKIDGTAEIGGESISFDVPFQTSGSITRGQLTEITTKALPSLPIPSGLKLPF